MLCWFLLYSKVIQLCIYICYSVAKLYLTLCNPMDCSTPGSPVLHYLLEFAQTHVHWVSDAIQPSYPLLLPSPLALNFPQHKCLLWWKSQLFTSGSQRIGASALVSVLPMNIQGWFPLGLTTLISLLSKGLSRVFSRSTVQKHQFFGAQPSLSSKGHIDIHFYILFHYDLSQDIGYSSLYYPIGPYSLSILYIIAYIS